jgi:uncharacterized RmlC-like cupin family protein
VKALLAGHYLHRWGERSGRFTYCASFTPHHTNCHSEPFVNVILRSEATKNLAQDKLREESRRVGKSEEEQEKRKTCSHEVLTS